MNKKKSRWKKRIAIICGLIFLLYAVIGFLGVPLLLRYVGLRALNDQLAGRVSVETIRANPFTFTLALGAIEAVLPDGKRVFFAERAYGNFAFWSLFRDGWQFQELSLTGPQLEVAVRKDGSLNLQDIVDKAPSNPDEETPNEPFVLPLLLIDRLLISDGNIAVSMDTPGGTFSRQKLGINVELFDFSTDPTRDNAYAFIAKTGEGEQAKVQGFLKLNPLSTRGSVKVDAVQLRDFAVFAADLVGFGVDEGLLSVGFDYVFSPVNPPQAMRVENGFLTLNALVLRGNGESEPFQELELFELKGVAIDLIERHVHLDLMRIEKGYLRVERDKSGLLNLRRYLFPESHQQEVAAMVQADLQRSAGADAFEEIRLGIISAEQDIGVALTSAWKQIQSAADFSWKLDVDRLDVQGKTLILRDRFLEKPVDYALSDIALSATALRNYGDTAFPYTFAVNTPNGGTVSAEGTFTPKPERATITYAVNGFDVGAFAPYVSVFTQAELRSLKISSKGEGAVSFPEDALPVFSLEFSARADDLKVAIPGFKQPLLTVESLTLDRARLASEPASFHADLLLINGPSLHLVRDDKGVFNFQKILKTLATESADTDKVDSEAAPAPASAFSLENISLGELRIQNGALTAEDQSVRPASTFAVKAVAFSLGPIAFASDTVSRFTATAALSGLSSGLIGATGEWTLPDPLKSGKISLTGTAVSLAPFGGYAEPMVGRAIENGTLDATFDYAVRDGMMRGSNQLKMNRLAFADRQPDSTGPNLPLDLGLAILVDRSGTMQLDLPVHGDLTDPDFEMRQVVIYAISNVFQKLVTAPFAVLGSLFGSDAVKPATQVTFAAGQSDVPASQLDGLNQLARALNERPALALVLRPVSDAAADQAALREELLQAQLEAYAKAHGSVADQAIAPCFQALLASMSEMEPAKRADLEAALAAAMSVAHAPVTVDKADTSAIGTQTAAHVETNVPASAALSKKAGGGALGVRGAGWSRQRRGYGVRSGTVTMPVKPTATPLLSVSPATSSPLTEGSASAAVVPAAVGKPEDLPVALKRELLLSQISVPPEALGALAQRRMSAIATVLTAHGSPYPLPADRVRVGDLWQATGEDAAAPTPTVYLELSVAK